MVVLEEGSMLTTGHNQYLQPDYLSPLPMTLDSKKSPLALLAQTCSQIGADSPSKPLLSSMEKTSKGSSAAVNARSPPAAKLERTRCSPSDLNKTSSGQNSTFKPYETNVVSKRSSTDSDSVASTRPASKASSVYSASGNESANNSASAESETNNNSNHHHNNNSNSNNNHSHSSHSHSSSKKSRATPVGRKSSSPATPSASPSMANSTERKTPSSDRDKSSASPRNNSGASPIIRSGMDVLSGKDSASGLYKSQIPGFPGANPLCCPPGLAENPAFRPPFGGASPFSHHHAAALLGYPPASSPTGNPYLSYARVKTPSGGESLVPVCKDPYCTGCQYSMHNAQMMMAAAAAAAGGVCPSGCTQCDHQKYGLMALSGLGGPMAPPGLGAYGAPGAAAAGGRPHVCSWIAGDSYCGKRFSSSEELLQHLRSHTSLANGTSDPAAAAAMLANQHAHPLLSPTAALQRAAAAAAAGASYPAPSLSPLSASRYHPYGKPPTGTMPASFAASPYSAFNALGPYYSPYAIYGQRLGAAVHP